MGITVDMIKNGVWIVRWVALGLGKSRIPENGDDERGEGGGCRRQSTGTGPGRVLPVPDRGRRGRPCGYEHRDVDAGAVGLERGARLRPDPPRGGLELCVCCSGLEDLDDQSAECRVRFAFGGRKD